MAKADHIYVQRIGYTHHGIDMGGGTVIHYTGEVGQKAGAAVRQTSRRVFAQGGRIRVRAYARCGDNETVLARARGRLREARYRLAFNNCEHFATWCKTGEHRSEQAKDTVSVAGGSVGAGAAVAGGLGAVSAGGAVTGLSGSGVMSGLAWAGAGTGAVGGLVAVGAAPAAVTVVAMHRVLRDDPHLPQAERTARLTGRVATIAGGVAGATAAIGSVSTAGAVAGLSAAGITSGLAAVGATVGGGMAAGVGIVAAAPAVAAAAVGYGIYCAWRFLAG
jgi:hypothetical protein